LQSSDLALWTGIVIEIITNMKMLLSLKIFPSAGPGKLCSQNPGWHGGEKRLKVPVDDAMN